MPGLGGGAVAQDRRAAGAGDRPAARRHRGPGGGRARHRAGADPGREGVRAGPAGAGEPRVSLYRRGEPARGSHRRPAARRRGLGRERGGARGAVDPACGALRAGRLGQSRGGRAAPAASRPVRPLGRGGVADLHRRPHRGDPPARRLRAGSRRLHAAVDRGRGEDAPEHRDRARAAGRGRDPGGGAAGLRRALRRARLGRAARRADAAPGRPGACRLRGRGRGRPLAPARAGAERVAPPAAPRPARRGQARPRGSDGRSSRSSRDGGSLDAGAERARSCRRRSGARRHLAPGALGPGARPLHRAAAGGDGTADHPQARAGGTGRACSSAGSTSPRRWPRGRRSRPAA